jgi:hypothetical protein
MLGACTINHRQHWYRNSCIVTARQNLRAYNTSLYAGQGKKSHGPTFSPPKPERYPSPYSVLIFPSVGQPLCSHEHWSLTFANRALLASNTGQWELEDSAVCTTLPLECSRHCRWDFSPGRQYRAVLRKYKLQQTKVISTQILIFWFVHDLNTLN